MKKAYLILLSALVALMFQGCDWLFRRGQFEEGKIHIPHYVLGYLDNAKNLEATYYSYENSINIRWAHSVLVLGWDSKGEDLAGYKALCNKNKDTKYDALTYTIKGDAFRSFGRSYRYYYNSNAITGINVTSDAAWDDAHPAGASLNDIIIFYSNALDPFIQSGYKEEFAWDEKKQKFEPIKKEDPNVEELAGRIECLLSKFDFSSYRLLGLGEMTLCRLKIAQKPTKELKHIIKIEILFEDGTKTFKQLSINFPTEKRS
ncbi:hypothetical protein [Porphyromonas canoris]|uniref:Lipoprotein n=1 Tax=Porphyromonas canoris TaxID=36875 RepID=A0ABR4XLP6_9PORP|nr:hypothetical protein [Porphyromonas canoris]KGN92887.1 hypothetical protein HQ43_03165 [Porphyromonas canoris]